MASSVRNMRLTSLDDLFSTEETRQAERQKTGEQVLSVPIDQVHDFANNPYKVRQDAELMDMVDSITRLGVHTPCLARPRKRADMNCIRVTGEKLPVFLHKRILYPSSSVTLTMIPPPFLW